MKQSGPDSYLIIAGALRRWIEHLRLAPGSRLPAERYLCWIYGCSRPVVRRAYDQLEAEGLVRHQSLRIRTAVGVHASDEGQVLLVCDEGSSPKPAPHPSDFIHAPIEAAIGSLRCSERPFQTLILPMGPWSLADLPLIGTSGVLLFNATVSDPELLHRLDQLNLPVVVAADLVPVGYRARLPCDQILGGQYDGARQLVEALGLRGVKRAVLAGFGSAPTGADQPTWLCRRLDGYVAGARRCGVRLERLAEEPILEQRVPVDLFFEKYDENPHPSWNYAVNQWTGFLFDALRGPAAVDAVIANTDTTVLPIAAAARRLGRIPGSDLSIAGFDASAGRGPLVWDGRENFRPTFSVDCRTAHIGRTMVEQLLARLTQPARSAPEVIVVDAELVAATC